MEFSATTPVREAMKDLLDKSGYKSEVEYFKREYGLLDYVPVYMSITDNDPNDCGFFRTIELRLH
jgi:hypothetical protein